MRTRLFLFIVFVAGCGSATPASTNRFDDPWGSPEPTEHPPSASARTGGYIRGQILDASSRTPITGATISFFNHDLTAQVSDDDGRFVSYEFEPGRVLMDLAHPNYHPGQCAVTIPEGQPEEGELFVDVHCDLVAVPQIAAIAPPAAPRPSAPAVSGASTPTERYGNPIYTDARNQAICEANRGVWALRPAGAITEAHFRCTLQSQDEMYWYVNRGANKPRNWLRVERLVRGESAVTRGLEICAAQYEGIQSYLAGRGLTAPVSRDGSNVIIGILGELRATCTDWSDYYDIAVTTWYEPTPASR